MELSQYEFERLTDYIEKISGISIPGDKKYLIHLRLTPLVVEAGCMSFLDYYNKLAVTNSTEMNDQIINAITTNETFFFRDNHPFETFESNILPELTQLARDRKERNHLRKGAKIGILCAGCSTGQEPYSIAMLIHRYITHNKVMNTRFEDFNILAIDISSDALAIAIKGEYNEIEINRGLPDILREMYFKKIGSNWYINNDLKKIIQFRNLNLLEAQLYLGGFDVIFCRNMMIYFNQETKMKILEQFHYLLSEHGYLILGGSENIYSHSTKFESVTYGNTILYKKR